MRGAFFKRVVPTSEKCSAFEKRSAFTLVELLVVIGVLVVLAAFLFPVFNRARERTRRTACQSNLLQLGLAFTQYAQDFDERLPVAVHGSAGATIEGGWVYFSTFGTRGDDSVFDVKRGSLFPYVKNEQIYICPTDEAGVYTGLTYAINSCVGTPRDNNLYIGKKLSAFSNSSQWMLLSEETMDVNNFVNSTDDGFLSLPYGNHFARRHFDGSNLLFMDNHSKWLRHEKISADGYQIGAAGPVIPDANGVCP